MLETIREFALERLEGAGEADAARQRHARAFLQLAQALRPVASLHSCFAPLVRLAAEQANLRAALAWLESHGPAADFGALVAALALSWYAYGPYLEGQEWIDRALATRDQLPCPERLRLLIGAAGVTFAQGDLEQTDRLLHEGRALAGAADDPVDQALLLMLRAAIWNEAVGEPAAAEALLREALGCADRCGDALLAAGIASRALLNLSVSARRQRDWERAATLVEASLACNHGGMLDLAEANSLLARGDIAAETGNPTLAARSWGQGLARLGERGDPRLMADALSGLARIATEAGQHRVAALLFGAADAARERTGAAALWPEERDAAARSWTVVQTALSESTAARLLAEGRRRSWMEIIGVAERLGAALAAVGDESPAGPATRCDRDIFQPPDERRPARENAAPARRASRKSARTGMRRWRRPGRRPPRR